MPEDNKGKGLLPGRLRGLLSSITPGTGRTKTRKGPEANQERDTLYGQQLAPVDTVVSGRSGGALSQAGYEVEIVPPEMASSPVAGDPGPGGRKRPKTRSKSEFQQADEVLLDGILEVVVVPPVGLARLSSFERALKERKGVRWLGTWGRPKEGTTLRLQLRVPVAAARFFEGGASVRQAELSRDRDIWRIMVSLAPEAGQVPAIEVPAAAAPPPPPVASSRRTEQAEEKSPPPYPEPGLEAASGSVDIEVSPIASLDSLTRFERLLASLSPGCRVLNVLSLDGVSTVLITLEGISGDALVRGLQDNIRDIKLDTSQGGRLVAALPDKW